MRITVFTSNQPRHLALVEKLLELKADLFVVQEVTSLFPGSVASFFKASPVMQAYFAEVLAAERKLFGPLRFLPGAARYLSVYPGDLKFLLPEQLAEGAEADLFIVFGTGFISGKLCDFLVSRRAVNIHMGCAPHYRGASCNMWAIHDRRPDLVTGTVHLLSGKMDHGDILFQALPPARAFDPFDLGMQAVDATLAALVQKIRTDTLFAGPGVPQETLPQGRYCRNAEFTDDVAKALLADRMRSQEVEQKLLARDLNNYILPVVG